jgi:hypothetical protein
MKIIISIVTIIVVFSGCSRQINNPELEIGKASLTIENKNYSAKAEMGHQTNFEKITLTINDSAQIEILRKNFIEKKYQWVAGVDIMHDIIFSLQYNFRGPLYMPYDGSVNITKRTSSIITGEFDITMINSYSSGPISPEILKHITGKFKVKIE